MPVSSVCATLTVYFDGQFWVALYEREDEAGLSVAHHTFGPEPSLPEIAELVKDPLWSQLSFLPAGSGYVRAADPGANPKRRQREAARQALGSGALTKAQAALKLALEEFAKEAKASGRERSLAQAAARRSKLVAKRKQKRRGR